MVDVALKLAKRTRLDRYERTLKTSPPVFNPQLLEISRARNKGVGLGRAGGHRGWLVRLA